MAQDYLSAAEMQALLDLAWESLRHGLQHDRPAPVDLKAFTGNAAAPGACFVTLHRQGRLRGCIGSLLPRQALAKDVSENAYNAGFQDPRFLALTAKELQGLKLSISVLTPLKPLEFTDEADLLGKLRPGVDGLLLEDGRNRGFFLPSVWSELPEPREFLTHLKYKAGLPADHWSPRLKVSRCESVLFGEEE
jgi:AmmeMemoRadiSam system protein A